MSPMTIACLDQYHLICLGRHPVVARRCLASYTPRLAELQVEGGNVGPNVGSAATPPSRLFTPFGPGFGRCGAGFSEPVQRASIILDYGMYAR